MLRHRRSRHRGPAAGPVGRRLSPATRTVVTAAALNALVVLPVFLLGALAVLIRRDLGFSEWQLGAAVSLFMAVGAAGSVPGGRIAQRIGARQAMSLVALVNGIALVGIATHAKTYPQLLGWLALAGAADALAQPATALAIAGGVSPARQGIGFGIKQSAGPGATMLAGLAVPAIGLTIGWRWAYVAAAFGAALFLILVPRGKLDRVAMRTRSRAITSGMRPLITLAVGVGFGAAAASALAAFYVESAVTHGIGVGAAGIWFAAGSIASIGARVWWGWLADRRDGGHLSAVALLMIVGAAGFGLMAHAHDAVLFAIGTALTFVAGWGWMGLFQFVIVRQNPTSPAAATGITQAGAFVGLAIGPVSFGALVEHISYSVAWWAGAGALAAGAVLIRIGRRMLLAARSSEPSPQRGS